MEDTLFAVLLFLAFNVFTALLIGTTPSEEESQVIVIEKVSETVSTTPEDTTVSTQSIEQQCKEVFRDILTPEEAVSLTEEQIDNLGIREARKVIAQLNTGLKRNDPERIRLKVNGKDQPKSWLISQIKSKLQQQPESLTFIQNVITASQHNAA